MEAILDFTEFSRAYIAIQSLFRIEDQDVIEYGMITDDTEMIAYVLDNHYIEHPEHYHTITLLKDLIPEPDFVYLTHEMIDYKIIYN